MCSTFFSISVWRSASRRLCSLLMSQSYVSVSQPHHSSARDSGAFGPHIRSSAHGTGGSASPAFGSSSRLSGAGGGSPGMRVVRGGVAGGRGGKGSCLASVAGAGGLSQPRGRPGGTGAVQPSSSLALLVDCGRGSCLAGGAEPAGAVALASGPDDATATREGPHGVPGGPRQALTARRQSWPPCPVMPHRRPVVRARRRTCGIPSGISGSRLGSGHAESRDRASRRCGARA